MGVCSAVVSDWSTNPYEIQLILMSTDYYILLEVIRRPGNVTDYITLSIVPSWAIVHGCGLNVPCDAPLDSDEDAGGDYIYKNM